VYLAEHHRGPKVPAVLLRQRDHLRTLQQTVRSAHALGPVPADKRAPD
jgi:hypothetical protein